MLSINVDNKASSPAKTTLGFEEKFAFSCNKLILSGVVRHKIVFGSLILNFVISSSIGDQIIQSNKSKEAEDLHP